MTTPIRPEIQFTPISPIERGEGMPLGSAPDGANFGDLLSRALGGVEATQTGKDNVIGAFMRGEPVELHQVMAAAEEASLSLQLLVETRNKLSEAYKSLMNTQV